MEFEKTKSSYLSGVAYDPGNQELQVQFKNGTIWKYFNVPEAAHVSLLLSESVGRYFGKEIRGVFSGRKVDPEDEDE